jgi:hypothetical protein
MRLASCGSTRGAAGVIDGVATRKRAPASFDLTPGKHKVTFVVGDDRFTFVATIKAGEVLTMYKDLQ